jgi:hypothetical protein
MPNSREDLMMVNTREGDITSYQVLYHPLQKNIVSFRWKKKVQWDTALYQAVNWSLDLMIYRIGCDKFEEQLERFRSAQRIISDRCLTQASFPCTSVGKKRASENMDCLWKDFI